MVVASRTIRDTAVLPRSSSLPRAKAHSAIAILRCAVDRFASAIVTPAILMFHNVDTRARKYADCIRRVRRYRGS